MNIQEMETFDYSEIPVAQEWPVMGECTKCGNRVLENLTVVGINDEVEEKYRYDMIRCYKCGTRWFW